MNSLVTDFMKNYNYNIFDKNNLLSQFIKSLPMKFKHSDGTYYTAIDWLFCIEKKIQFRPELNRYIIWDTF